MDFAAMHFADFTLLTLEGSVSWWDYPGVEVWRFVNLGIFVVGAIYLHRVFGGPIGQALRTRRERIRQELTKAREERDRALLQLADVESRLEGLDAEIEAIRERSRVEASAEYDRIEQLTEIELSKLRENAKREIDSVTKAAVKELRRFASKQSIRLAEEFIRQEIGPADEARLVKLRADGFGGKSH